MKSFRIHTIPVWLRAVLLHLIAVTIIAVLNI